MNRFLFTLNNNNYCTEVFVAKFEFRFMTVIENLVNKIICCICYVVEGFL